ncbi:unnamed protein product, partial [Gulo gulo]
SWLWVWTSPGPERQVGKWDRNTAPHFFPGLEFSAVDCYLGQAQMWGSVTEDSVILHAKGQRFV